MTADALDDRIVSGAAPGSWSNKAKQGRNETARRELRNLDCRYGSCSVPSAGTSTRQNVWRPGAAAFREEGANCSACRKRRFRSIILVVGPKHLGGQAATGPVFQNKVGALIARYCCGDGQA